MQSFIRLGFFSPPNCYLQKSRYTHVWDIVGLCAKAGFLGTPLDPAPCPTSFSTPYKVHTSIFFLLSLYSYVLFQLSFILHAEIFTSNVTLPIQHIPQSLTSAANSKQNRTSNRPKISFRPITRLVSLQLTALILL